MDESKIYIYIFLIDKALEMVLDESKIYKFFFLIDKALDMGLDLIAVFGSKPDKDCFGYDLKNKLQNKRLKKNDFFFFL